VLYVERTLVKALPKLEKEAAEKELAKGFGDHLAETRHHVSNVAVCERHLAPSLRPCCRRPGDHEMGVDLLSKQVG
jgi:ferritin-like metal-binding protein YciE